MLAVVHEWTVRASKEEGVLQEGGRMEGLEVGLRYMENVNSTSCVHGWGV